MHGVAHRLHRGHVRQVLEVRLDTVARRLELLLDRLQRIAVVGRQRRHHVGGHQIAVGGDGRDLGDGAGGFGGIVSGNFRRTEDRVQTRLRIQHGRTGRTDEGELRLAECFILLVMQRAGIEPLARG